MRRRSSGAASRANGDIYKGDYEGWYCTVDEIFVPETQLVDGRCPTCGNKVERLKEESYYFRLSKYQQPLLDFYATNPDFLQPAFRLNEIRTFVEAGLQDLSVSRTSFQWGIPVPDDPKHVMYVWFDALTNYLTALGFGAGPSSAYRHYRSAGRAVLARGHASGRQGNHPAARALLAGVPDVGGHDAAAADHRARLVADGRREDVEVDRQRRSLPGLCRASSASMRCATSSCARCRSARTPTSRTKGSSTRFNADLANDLGNVVSRATTMIQRYCDGRRAGIARESRDDLDRSLEKSIDAAIDAVKANFECLSDHAGAAGNVGPDPRGEPVHRAARAVGAGKEARGSGRSSMPRCITRRTPCGSRPR